MKTRGMGFSRIAMALAVLVIVLSSKVVSAAFYLHGAGPNANPPTLFLDNTSPAAATAKYRDSAGVNFSGGNPWKEIGTWTVPATGTLTALNDLHLWLGLKNSDDIGTRFDLRTEVYRNGQSFIASSDTYCIQDITRNETLAKEILGSFGSFSSIEFSGADTLSLKVLTRIGTNGAGGFCGGHSNAVGLRLYFDAVSRPSRFAAALSENLPPVADAGLDQNVLTGDRVTLDGRNSHDPEGALITYSWSFAQVPAGSHATFDNPASVMPSFVPDLPGNYIASLTVNDGRSNSLPDNVTISAARPNVAPTANAGPDQSAVTGSLVQLNGTGSFDPDGDPITYSWSFLSLPSASHAVLNYPTTATPNFVTDADGQYLVGLTVNDGQLSSLPDNVLITAARPNAPPVANAGPDNTVSRNTLIQLDSRGSYDPDNDPLTFAWSIVSKPLASTGPLDNTASPTPTMLADAEGDFVYRLLVNDGHVDSAPDTVVMTSINDPPVANAGPDQSVPRNTTLTLDGSGSHDANGDPLTYAWSILSAPPGSSATIGNPSAVNPLFTPVVAGTYLIRLIVSDGAAQGTDNVTISATPLFVTVPNVVGQLQATAQSAIVTASLTVGAVTQANSATIPAGNVISQSPAAGSIVPEGTAVDLIVSLGPALVTVPNVVAMTQSNAQAAIIAAGLVVGTINNASSPTVPSGSVVSQSPTGGTSVLPGSAVSLVVSTGPVMVSVPDLFGKPQSSAQTLITGAGLAVGGTTTGYSETVIPGGVVSQNPAAGTSVPQGSPVATVISSGPAPVTLPPDPASVAPPVDPTVATNVYTATRFLYTGTNPIQTDVAPDSIELIRAAVVRGQILATDNSPLPGVAVSILGHPELGQTRSRDDGKFDLVVNGGGPTTVEFRKGGYLSVQRQVSVPWQDYVVLDSIVMIPFDTQVTAVDLTSPAPIQAARGSVVTDSDGVRQATLLFTQGTTASMVLPDGSTRPLSILNVRATEYTRGANGPRAMPAELPATSAYTYCVEFSVDEATAAGATDVTFSSPVIHYVENFLNFPVGIVVPVGYYDRKKGAWIPSDNGKVVKILSVTGGLADLDTDGDGLADDPVKLAALGITAAEQGRLASLYLPGATLWRVSVSHFTPWDGNWPFGLPLDAVSPGLSDIGTADDVPDPICTRGSVIECQNQVLGESISIQGTSMSLNYRSNRVPGRKQLYSVKIPLSGPSVPSSLRRIDLEISIAGRSFTNSHSTAPNQSFVFEWDGRDVFGRPVYGKQPIKVRIGYLYGVVYLGGGAGKSFAQFGNTPITGSRSRMEVTLWQEWNGYVGAPNPLNPWLGAWSLDIHHAYDPLGRFLYLGDGTMRFAENMSIFSTVAGTGQAYIDYSRGGVWTPGGAGYSGDGDLAVKARMNSPMDVAVGPDGTIFIADTTNNVVRKVDKNGIITTIAGINGHAGYNGDGILATQAWLWGPISVAMGPDGSLYIAENSGKRIRRIGKDGIIATVAGNGQSVYAGDGSQATQTGLGALVAVAVGKDGVVYFIENSGAIRRVGTDGIITTLTNVYGWPYGIAVGPDGSVYFTDNYDRSVHRIDPNGKMTLFAGGSYGNPNDGKPATQAWLNLPYGVATGPDGSVYISEYSRIRRVDTAGIITTIAGNGLAGIGGEGGAATQANVLYAKGVEVGPDGAVYYADDYYSRVRKIGAPFPGLSMSDLYVASVDGRELYVFNGFGKHQRTLSALTGAVLYRFEYDASGLLHRVVDGDNNATIVERDVNGNPAAIAAPGGQRTTLTVDGNGYLATIADPAGNTQRYGYTFTGLMTSYIDPNGFPHGFAYDAAGRLTRDDDPEEGFISLLRTDNTAASYTVDLTTALGRKTSYFVDSLSTGSERRVNTFPTGGRSDSTRGTDAKTTTSFPDGTTTTVIEGPDPRFGMKAPFVSSATVTTPGGLVATTTATRTASLSNPYDLLSLLSQTDTLTVNGKAYTQIYTASTKRFTLTTPASRITEAGIDNQGRVLSVKIAPSVDNVTFAYDLKGRLAQAGQGGKSWTFDYDGLNRLTSVSDPLAYSVQYAYDSADRVVRVILPSGRTYQFGYDPNGNRTSITMPSGAVHGLGYTKINLDNSYTPPGNPAYGTQYNLDRDWKRTSLPSGRAIDGGYDNGGRLRDVTYPDAAVAMTYFDNTDRAGTITRTAAPIPDNTTQTLSFSYDGFLTTRVAFSGVANGEYRYSFDNNFWITGVALDNVWTTFSRDNDGLLTRYGPFAITRNGPAGASSALTDNVLNVSYTYDSSGRPWTRTHTVAGQSVYAIQLGYDNVGRISTKTETVAGTSHTFDYTYDLDGQLVEVRRDSALVEQYGYDNNANRTSTLAAMASYDDQDRLIQQGGVAYTFDADGFLAQRGTDTFQYSARGELLSTTVGGQTIAYQYDGMARRIAKTDATGVTQYLYGNPGNPFQVTASRDAAGILTNYFYDTAGNLYALERGGVHFYIATDQLGTPKVITDSVGNVVKAVEYDAWGVKLPDTNPTFDLPVGFAGGIGDAATGLVRFGWRDYEPRTGRWAARDPVLFEGGQGNLFVYVGNSPVNATDPSGLWRLPDFVSGNVNITIPTPWTGKILSWTFSASADRYGNWYWSPVGPGAGRARWGASFSLTANWLLQGCKPTSAQLSDFLSGNGVTVAGGKWVGGNLIISSGNGAALGFGFVTPQIGANYSYSFKGPGNTGVTW